MSDTPNISRRQLLRGRLSTPPADQQGPRVSPGQDEPASSARHRSRVFPVIRPPGAVEEAQFLRCCTKCEACKQACPHDAIIDSPIRFRGAAGTPMVDPAQAPCLMCEDMPCVAACPEQALVPEAFGPIAEARLLDYNCLAHQGSFCTVCHEQCPVPEAITLFEGKPQINTNTCTGCGVCHYACPAPTNAIAMMPLRVRPKPMQPSHD